MSSLFWGTRLDPRNLHTQQAKEVTALISSDTQQSDNASTLVDASTEKIRFLESLTAKLKENKHGNPDHW